MQVILLYWFNAQQQTSTFRLTQIMKPSLIAYKRTDEWYIEQQQVIQRVTTNYNKWYNEWQLARTSDATSDSEPQRVIMSENEWQKVTSIDNEWYNEDCE